MTTTDYILIGFGFVLVGGDYPGQLITIKEIIRDSSAYYDGVLQNDDILVRVDVHVILMEQHQTVVEYISSIHQGSAIDIEVHSTYCY